MMDSIENGCQSFIITQQASQTFLDDFNFLHDRTITQHSNKKIIILIDSQTSEMATDQIFQHDAIHDIPQLLLLIPKGQDRIDLMTNRFVTQDHHHELILLDRFVPSLGTFMYASDLFPNKLHDLEGRFLRLALFKYHPYTIWNEVSSIDESNANYEQKPTLSIDGTESRIFLEFCSTFNCSLDISLDEAGEWGEIFDNRTGNGIIGAVVERRADIGVGALYSWHHESIYLSLSKPISRTGVTCITPKPRLLSGWLIPILPFSQNLWIAVLSTFLCMSCFSLFVNYMVDNVLNKENRRVDLCESFMIIGSIFILQSVLLRINRSKLVSQLIVMGSLLFVGLMIGNLYSGGLSSIMTIPRYEPPVDTLEDLANSNLPWASTHDAWIFSILMATQPTIIRILHNFQTHPKEVLHKHTKQLDMAYSVERLPYGHFAIGEYIDEEASHKFHLMKEDIYWENCVAMSTKTWPMMDQLDQLILIIFQSGIQRYWELQVVSKYENDEVQLAIATSRHPENDGPIVLQLSHLLGAFLMLGFGLAAGLATFMVEVMLGKFM
ncbi:AAEL000007-PA [Aedes aegypti]|uniref:AAEL000007-PA n=1 Tax=Aedes aegypti TaxID=7159 RepID=Q0C756_AEDAE|nr:AAEL000007-PA [Aedes aegypti]